MAEEIGFENGRNSNFQGLVTLTLTLDPVIRHTVVHQSTCIPNFIEIEETFCGRTYGRTFFPPLILLGRLLEVGLKRVKTERKSTHKQQHSSCSNYIPLDWTARSTWSVTKKRHTPHFCTYNQHTSYDLPQTLHGDRARWDHQKGGNHFLIQRIVFPTGCTKKFGLIDRRAVSQQLLRYRQSKSCQIWNANVG